MIFGTNCADSSDRIEFLLFESLSLLNRRLTVDWGPSTKLGFDKSKVTCFKCKQKVHFKRECRNSATDETANPFHNDYYRKAKEKLINAQLDEIANLKLQYQEARIENERINLKLNSYTSASFVLQHIVPKTDWKEQRW
ncbi:putative transcription factor interactor and regulator CCHC(Zn) family [Helianthus anomalus]